MNTLKKVAMIIVVLIIMSLTLGCCKIIQGSEQKIWCLATFEKDADKDTGLIFLNNTLVGKNPKCISIPRKTEVAEITFQAPGYEAQTQKLARSLTWRWIIIGDIIILPIWPLWVWYDIHYNYAYEFDPKEVRVIMKPLTGPVGGR